MRIREHGRKAGIKITFVGFYSVAALLANEDRITGSSLWGSKNTLVFWRQQWFRQRPLPPKICAQSDPPPSEKRRLQPISAYNVSTIRTSEKSSIIANRKSTTRFTTSYRWSSYVTLKSLKGCSKSKFVIFVNKNQFKLNKLLQSFVVWKLPVAKL